MKIPLILLASLLASVSSIPKVLIQEKDSKKLISQDGNALTCAICIDLVTDIDEFLTSDTTEDQIVQFVEQVFICQVILTYTPDIC